MPTIFAYTADVSGSTYKATVDGAVEFNGDLVTMEDYETLRESIDILVKSKYINRVNVTLLSLTRLSK